MEPRSASCETSIGIVTLSVSHIRVLTLGRGRYRSLNEVVRVLHLPRTS